MRILGVKMCETGLFPILSGSPVWTMFGQGLGQFEAPTRWSGLPRLLIKASGFPFAEMNMFFCYFPQLVLKGIDVTAVFLFQGS